MKRFFLIVLLIPLIFMGCSSRMDKEEVTKFSDPMTENMLQGLNNKDYEKFSRDLGPLMKEALNEDVFTEVLVEQIQEVIGTYESMEIGKVTTDSNKGIEYIVVIYKAKFSKEPGDVAVTLWFTKEKENRKIESLFFNSPKLIEASVK